MDLQKQLATARFAVEYTAARATFEPHWLQHYHEAVEELRQLEAQLNPPALVDLSDGALEVLYQQSDRVNIIRESELMTLIEQSDLKE